MQKRWAGGEKTRTRVAGDDGGGDSPIRWRSRAVRGQGGGGGRSGSGKNRSADVRPVVAEKTFVRNGVRDEKKNERTVRHNVYVVCVVVGGANDGTSIVVRVSKRGRTLVWPRRGDRRAGGRSPRTF